MNTTLSSEEQLNLICAAAAYFRLHIQSEWDCNEFRQWLEPNWGVHYHGVFTPTLMTVVDQEKFLLFLIRFSAN
jgi:hypothetical protein